MKYSTPLPLPPFRRSLGYLLVSLGALLALSCAGADSGDSNTDATQLTECQMLGTCAPAAAPSGATPTADGAATGGTPGGTNPVTPPPTVPGTEPMMGPAMASDDMMAPGTPTLPMDPVTDPEASTPEPNDLPMDPVATEPAPVTEPDDPTEDPGEEDPMTEDPMTEDPSTEDPMTEDPMTEDPTMEEPPVEEPVDPVATPSDEVPAIEYCAGVSAWEAEWSAWEEEVLVLVNEHRAAGADCGSQGSFEPAGPLSMDPLLRCTSRVHSLDMYERDFFSHDNPDGDGPGERLDDAGYMGSTWGENIAQGYSDPAEVVEGWMGSDGHCSNIMNDGFSLIGVGYHPGAGGNRGGGHFWTQNFGAPPRQGR